MSLVIWRTDANWKHYCLVNFLSLQAAHFFFHIYVRFISMQYIYNAWSYTYIPCHDCSMNEVVKSDDGIAATLQVTILVVVNHSYPVSLLNTSSQPTTPPSLLTIHLCLLRFLFSFTCAFIIWWMLAWKARHAWTANSNDCGCNYSCIDYTSSHFIWLSNFIYVQRSGKISC